MTYRNDFARCDGKHCKVKEKCARFDAFNKPTDTKIPYIMYLIASDCIKAEYSEFVAIVSDNQ